MASSDGRPNRAGLCRDGSPSLGFTLTLELPTIWLNWAQTPSIPLPRVRGDADPKVQPSAVEALSSPGILWPPSSVIFVLQRLPFFGGSGTTSDLNVKRPFQFFFFFLCKLLLEVCRCLSRTPELCAVIVLCVEWSCWYWHPFWGVGSLWDKEESPQIVRKFRSFSNFERRIFRFFRSAFDFSNKKTPLGGVRRAGQ